MIAILEKYEHNVDFHHIVDFVEASHIRYALTINPTIYVSQIRQFWSTVRIKTTDEGTKILATVDGKLRTISESSTRRNLKLNDEEGISTLPDVELFANLALIGARIAQSSALPTAADEPASPLGDDNQGEACPTARIKMLEDKDRGGTEPSGKDAPIKGRSLETGEEAANILTSRVQVASVPPATEVSTVGIPSGNGMVPTASPIFTTTSVVTPYSRRKDGLDRNNETIDKYLQEHEQFGEDFSIEEKIDMINELVKYQGLKIKQFKGMTLDEIKEKFISVWKQIEDFVSMASKEEGETFKRKGLRLEQDNAKKVKTAEDVSEKDLKEMMQLVPVEEVYMEALQVKHPIIDWEIHTEGQRNYWKIIRLGGHIAVYQFFVDMLKNFEKEDLTQLWTLVKETFSIRQATSDKEKEL
nr:hypothetical protein [Tanacetum cinerariifolium]